VLAAFLTGLTLAGMGQAVAGLLAVRRFAARELPPPATEPPVTILKPICGNEALLEEAISSFCVQHYNEFQLVIGAQDPGDPALHVARRVQARFPQADITVMVSPPCHARNRKIANLMGMMPAAKHDVLILADSDLHVRPDYLRQVVAALQQPGCGLVTTACAAEPVARRLVPELGAAHITHTFLPGALLAAAGGRQDCLGGTMALRRETLAQIGGLPAMADHLADDNVLGALVRRLGLSVKIARTLPVMVVQETGFRALWLHEVRWARTIRAVAPLGFAAGAVQFPVFWALLAVLASGGAAWAVAWCLAAWAVRAAVAAGIDRALRARRARPAPPAALWLLPLRDLLSVAVLLAGFLNNKVVWRGHTLRADRGVTPLKDLDTAGFAPDDKTGFAPDESLQV
jgi:ceramide glucosyltransferase